MKPLASALWLAALAIAAWGWALSTRANRLAAALSAASTAPGDWETNRRAQLVSGAEKTAPAPRPAAKSSPPAAARPGAWKYTPETAEERKARFGTPLPNSPSARTMEETIRVRLRYHSFYAANGLTRDQVARFEQALAGKMDPFTNVSGMPPEQEASLRQNLARTLDETVRQTFGEALVPRMREFLATADLREVADKLAYHTFHTETPLTAQQADRLVQACLDCRTDPGNGIRNLPGAVDWARVMQQAQSFLTPSQLSTLSTMTDMRRFDQEFKQSTGVPYRPPVRNF